MVDTSPKLNTIEEQEAYEKLSTPIKDLEGAPSVYTSETNRPSTFAEIESIRSAPYSNWETFKNSAKLMWQDTSLGVYNRYSELKEARKEVNDSLNPILSPTEANAKYSQYGVHFNEPIRAQEAEIIASRKVQEMALRQRLQQTEGGFMSGASSLLGGFAGAMLDPINIATAFIPVTKVIPVLKTLETAGIAGRIALKGLDGMIMNSLVEPAPLWMSQIDQRDYTMADSLFNVVAGGVFGAGLGTIAEGFRALSPGEKFNANLAASIDFANNRGLDNVREFQARRPIATALDYDTLVTMPNESLHIVKEGNTVFVRLRDEGEMSHIVGRGRNLDEAKQSLRNNLTGVFGDDSIYKGYRLDDGIENLFSALKSANDITTYKWMPQWIAKIEKRAIAAGMSLEDYLAKHTKNFTDFTKVIKAAKELEARKGKYSGFYGDAFDNLSGEALDDLIENGAEEMTALARLKEAFNKNPRRQITADLALGDLREQVSKEKNLYNKFLEMTDTSLRDRMTIDDLKKQLDATLDIAERENLMRQINELEASLNTTNNELSRFLSENDVDSWKYNADNVSLLEDIRAKLTDDPRDFGDIKEQLTKQLEMDKKWDTKIGPDVEDTLTAEELHTDMEPDARIAQFEEDIATDLETIKTAIANKQLPKDVASALDIDSEGYTSEMRKADEAIEKADQFNQDIVDFVECRKTEEI